MCSKIRVLLAPLNWGLGHATRCLPIAAALTDCGCEVNWASDGAALALLRAELPASTAIYELPGYGICHGSGGTVVNGLRQTPGLWRGIRAERVAVSRLHATHRFDLILSDNRYGCLVAGVPSYIICHQVHLPIANPVLRWLPNLIHQRLVRRFDELVVPDYAPPHSLAGAMSRPLRGMPTSYLGAVSRFQGQAADITETDASVAIVLSGPEPARTSLETIIVQELLAGAGGARKVVLVRGLPRGGPALPTISGVKVHDFLPAKQLGGVLAKAETIVTRPGYTTVMDLAALRKFAVYIPTPGQPEQLVLAKALAQSGRGVMALQNGLELGMALADAAATKVGVTGEVRGVGMPALSEWAQKVVARFPRA